ncbi:hypothetical protein [Flavobacterium sp. 3-210]
MIEIGTITISTIIGFVIGYFTSYFNEKGKNKALIEDTKRITEEKEKVTSHYALDITKRTFRYEDKRSMYFKYFNLLDEMQTEGNKIAQAEMLPAINKFMQNHLNANGNTNQILKSTSALSTSANNAMMKMHESQIKLKNETNSIRLVAGESVLNALSELERLYDIQLETSSKMMKDLAKNVVGNKQHILLQQKNENEILANKINFCKENIIREMKKELDEI